MTTGLPDDSHRWRCSDCGNPTRCDVTRTRGTMEFWHFDLSGDHQVESTELKKKSVAVVSCRWCGRDDAIELVNRNEATFSEDPSQQPSATD